MRFDPFKFVRSLEAKHPKLAHKLVIFFLNLVTPFNGHLKTRMLEWSDNSTVVELKHSRGVCNHLKAIHAGAQFTLGETCAGLAIIRNFPFAGYRPIMSNVSVVYSKQARGDVIGECLLPQSEIDRVKDAIAKGEVPTIEMTTNISGDVNGSQEIISVVKTIWQIKPWGLVKSK